MTITVLGKTRDKKIQSYSPLWEISHFYMLKKKEHWDHV